MYPVWCERQWLLPSHSGDPSFCLFLLTIALLETESSFALPENDWLVVIL
jgi:hypothetical protein